VRRFALFGATVLVPCALLVVFGYRMIRQDGELAAMHAEDEQRARVVQQRQRRVAALEKWKRGATVSAADRLHRAGRFEGAPVEGI